MNRYFLCASLLLISLSSLSVSAEREPWTSSRVTGSPEPPKPYAVERVYPMLQFNQPVELMPLADTSKMMLLEVGGKLFTFDDDPQCEKADLALDVSKLIQPFHRALGFSVHPKFMENREIFICYAGGPVARHEGTRLSRFRVTKDNPPRIDPASEEILLTWASGGHNGCAIRFDQHGFLYFSAGDGARPYPPDEYDVSQDLSDLRATICRIDVDRHDGERGYSIPPDNPFIDLPNARPEIWAYGFRNPWRFSIDPQTQQLMCGDVGWELWELVHHVERGGNYGWSIFEGPQPIRSDIKPGPTPIRKPIVAYPHTEGLSITGGFTYRGNALPELTGSYLYGDYVTGLVWGLRFEGEQPTWNPVLAETGLRIITFSPSRDGEVLVMSYDGGIYKLVKNQQSDRQTAFPRLLSETGLFLKTASLQPASGVYSYDVATRAWQDGATSEFVIGVPGDASVATNKQQRNWKYPIGTVFAKTLSMDSVVDGRSEQLKIETQLIHYDGISWQPYSYAWNEEQTDAVLVDGAGAVRKLQVPDGQGGARIYPWRFHSRSECRACHINQAGGAVGFTLFNLQLSRSLESRQTQIGRFVDLAILDRHPPKDWNITRMVDPADASTSIELRARSYLAANCAHCHCRGGGGTVALDLSYFNSTDNINAINFPTTQGDFGIQGGKVIVPGDPYRSILYYRMATTGNGHMPKLWKRDNDENGLALVHDWIASLEAISNPKGHSESSAEELGSTTQALRFFHRLVANSDKMSEGKRQEMAADAFKNADAVTQGLFERFLPPDRRIKRLGTNIDRETILAMNGDAKQGRQRFLTSKVQQCRTCHRLDGQGQMVGPDLDGIAKKRSTTELLESILEPSSKIEPEFVSLVIVTVDDQVLSGLRIDQDSGSVIIRSADGKTHSIAQNDIEHMTVQSKSLMPEGLAAQMTAQELADLLAFLSSLK